MLIPRENPDDPPTFYIMQNKVSNGLFKAAMGYEEFKELLAQQQQKFPKLNWGEWSKGGVWKGGEDVGSGTGKHPVLRVNVMEAYCFARWVKGNLPLFQQWDRAGGKGPGVTNIFRDPLEPLLPGDVAINRVAEGPMEIGEARRDVSTHGCFDMAGNGQEWTRNLDTGGLVSPENLEGKDLKKKMILVAVRSQRYYREKPFNFKMPDDFVRCDLSEPGVGFRVVVEP